MPHGRRSIDMRQEFLETRKQATFSRALIDAVDERLEERRADHAAAQSPRIFQLRRVPRLRRTRRMRELLRHPDVSSPRSAHAVPLLQLLRTRSRTLPQVRQRITFSSSALARSAWKTNCTARFPRPASLASIATRCAASATTKTCCSAFREGDYDILVGTQMIAKGHDIPNVTLVGIVSADIGLGLPDFRAAERTFQLLTQAGRTRRTRRDSRHRADPDHQSRSLRHALRRRAGLPSVLSKGNRIPPVHDVSAVRLDRQRHCPRPQTRKKRCHAARLWDACCNPRPKAFACWARPAPPWRASKTSIVIRCCSKRPRARRLHRCSPNCATSPQSEKWNPDVAGDRRGPDDV